jgi:FtsZ-interacting cell division protein ZipA
MKNSNNKITKWLVVAGCFAVCVVLVVLIGSRFTSTKPVDQPLPPPSSQTADVTVSTDEQSTENVEKEVVVTPPDVTEPANEDNGAVSSGTEQTIQADVSKPEYSEEQLKDPTQKPSGEKVTEPPTPVEHDKVEKPKDVPSSSSKPSGGLPGFDNVPNAGENKVHQADDMYENGNKIGIMD